MDDVGEIIGDVSITIGYLTPLEARLWERTLFENERIVHEKRLVNEYCKHYTQSSWMDRNCYMPKWTMIGIF